MTENELKKTIAIYKKTLEVTADNGETCFRELDKNTLLFLEELEQYRAIGTVEGYKRALEISKENFRVSMEYKAKVQAFEAIGTVEEFKALKEQDHDCIIKHLSGECSYKETGCSDCKSKWKIKDLLEKNEPKKVIGIESGLQSLHCPSCSDWSGFEIKKGMKFCPNCGQALET